MRRIIIPTLAILLLAACGNKNNKELDDQSIQKTEIMEKDEKKKQVRENSVNQLMSLFTGVAGGTRLISFDTINAALNAVFNFRGLECMVRQKRHKRHVVLYSVLYSPPALFCLLDNFFQV